MKTAPRTSPHSSFVEPAFLSPSSEINIEIKPKTPVNAYGTYNAENTPEFNLCNACQAAVIEPVIAAKFVRDWIVKKSLTAGFSSVPLDASNGDAPLVVVLSELVIPIIASISN